MKNIDTELVVKIKTPPPLQQTITRSHLIATLDRAASQHKLVLLAAAAGYGKTTLLAQWARASDCTVAWLSLDEGDNDWARFLRYLLASWQAVQPEVADSTLHTALSGMAPDYETVRIAFVNAAHEIAAETIFILDDYHLIQDPAVHETLTFFLDHLPPQQHFVLGSRAEPPFPLARYRARQMLFELGPADLSFRPDESAGFLEICLGQKLPAEALATLQEQLEGWVTGLQLVALSMRRGLTNLDQLVIDGRHRFIADYLSQEILTQLPVGTQRFLLQTSILERLTGSLCQAVTGQTNSASQLAALERDNLFLLPLDDRREWYRYHFLFAEFLRQELLRRASDDVAGLHRRAAIWYQAHDWPEQAFHHAVAGQDVVLILQLLERYVQPMLIGGQFTTLKQWFDRFPEAWLAAYPMIDLFRTGLLLFTGQLEASVHCVASVEQRLTAAGQAESKPQLARVKAMRCSIACFQDDLVRAQAYADEAFLDLSPDDLFFRTIIYGSLGDTYRRHQQWHRALRCYEALLKVVEQPAYRLQSVHVFGALADLYLRQGHIQQAAGYWHRALALIHERQYWGRFPLPLIGWVYIRLAELHYEWNELTAARENLSSGLERAELGGDVRALLAGYLTSGRLAIATDDAGAAEACLNQAHALAETTHFAQLTSRLERLQVELWLARGELRSATSWAEAHGSGDGWPVSASQQLTLARVLIARGDQAAVTRSMAQLRQLLPAVATEGRLGIQIEALALLAMAHWRQGEVPDALTELEAALGLAEPEGYIRSFVDLGRPMARLLQEAQTRDVRPDYIATLLAAFDNQVRAAGREPIALPEPLTQRETEVLALLAAGLTNREIASTLVVAVETVKKHASHIYGKLSVKSRTEAVARARELNLLA